MSVPLVSRGAVPPPTLQPNDQNHRQNIAFPDQPVAIPNDRIRKFTVAAEQRAFSEGLAELKSLIGNKSWSIAFQLSKQLFERYLTTATLDEKIKLIELFEKIAKKGKNVLGTDFYAFLRAAITADIECIDNHDPEQVISGYKEAADLGNRKAMYFLGRYYARIERYDDAFHQFLACATRFPDYVEAVKEVAIYYHQGGDLEPIDLKRAEEYYRKAIMLGCKDSPCNLAGMLESQRVHSDGRRAEIITLYSLAKARGSSDAAFNLGVIYQTGWYRTSEDGQKCYSEQYVNYDEAEVNFRIAYAGEMSDVNAAGVAEILFDYKAKLTAERWEEMQALIARIQANGSNEADELIEKIEAQGAVIDLQILADAAEIHSSTNSREVLNKLALTYFTNKAYPWEKNA